jgi:hypothetical protein
MPSTTRCASAACRVYSREDDDIDKKRCHDPTLTLRSVVAIAGSNDGVREVT